MTGMMLSAQGSSRSPRTMAGAAIAKGFSLIELLVVLVILGLIAGLVVPNIMQRGEDARVRAAQAEIQRLSMAVDEFYLDTGRAPNSLRELVERPSNARNWNGPYVNASNLNDPWDRPYEYRYPGRHRGYDIFSPGVDGRQITNWD